MNGNTYNTTDIEFYGEFYPLLREAIDKIIAFIKEYSDTAVKSGSRDPVEHIKSRIKSYSSAKAKLTDRRIEPSAINAITAIHDAAGLRVVCTFIDDIYELAESLRNRTDFKIIMEKDYIRNPKTNGYRSYHMIVGIDEGDVVIPVEIQLRSVAMDCWGALEHQIKYKRDIKHEELIEAELKKCADDLALMDINLQVIRDILE
ncbi:MAG: GTP pyrophosphokinase family protein [Clostridiales bacterium]|jgi:putative GTP pyrophosphokinase|nr:GTP pyrophosphokinase family protein [Clostridiales bacterium]